MGTRSLTKVYNQFSGEIITTMYVNFDGYLSGVGKSLKDCLHGVNVVNGYSNDTPKPFVNRMGQLVSYIVKNSGLKIEFMDNKEQDYIDYTYHLRFLGGKVEIEVFEFDEVIYKGLVDDFDPVKLESEMSED